MENEVTKDNIDSIYVESVLSFYLLNLLKIILKKHFCYNIIGDYIKKSIILVLFLVFYLICTFRISEKENNKEENNNVNIEKTIIKKDDFGFHNTSIRKENIKYIVIHFSGADADASSFIELYN